MATVEELEKRVAELERELAALKRHIGPIPQESAADWLARTAGIMEDDEVTREIMRLGREYRDSVRDPEELD